MENTINKEGSGKIKKQILIVDDDILVQRVVSQILKMSGYEVEIASDGNVALEKINKEDFDLILTDISMPNLDGYQLLEYMQKSDINIPVVFMSGHAGNEAELKVLEMGAAEYLNKPINSKLLLLRLDNILNS